VSNGHTCQNPDDVGAGTGEQGKNQKPGKADEPAGERAGRQNENGGKSKKPKNQKFDRLLKPIINMVVGFMEFI